MRGLLLLPAFLLALSCCVTSEAHAHGGNFREDAPPGPGMPDPEIRGGRRSPVTTERSGWVAGDWNTWWRLNREAFLPDKRSTRRRAANTESSSLFGVGEAGRGRDLTRWERTIEQRGRMEVLPFLLKILDPAAAHDDRLIAASLIALGRVAQGGSAVRILARHAADETAHQEVRESAILGLGLLRRSDADLQLDVATLTEVRRFLLGIFDDKDAPTRARAFAIHSLALLSDQPYPDTAFDRAGRRITKELWGRLEHKYPDADLPVALLTALGMQPPAGVPGGVLAGLKAIAMDKPYRGRRWKALLRSHALSAYARLDGPAWHSIALWSLRGTRDHVAVRTAAAIAITRRAGDLSAERRFEVAKSMLTWLPREPNWFAAGLQHIALASLLRAELTSGGSRLVDELHLGKHLRRGAERGRTMTRPYAGLALGLAIHGVEPDTKTNALLLKSLREALARLLRNGRGADDVLGAYAVGLGLAGAVSAHKVLLDVLEDRKRGTGLRGHCALALAQLGCRTPEVRAALHKAAAERVSPRVHLQAVRALAVLAVPGASTRLMAQLERTRSRYAVAVAASALGRLGDPEATKTLVGLAGDPVEGLEVRIMAVVALGLIFDPEPRPSRVRMTTHANYPARTPSLSQVFNIQ